MDTKTQLWGEFDEPQRFDDLSIPLSNLEDLVLPSASPPQLYQPSQEETASFQILPSEMCQSDPMVLHTIRLLQHQRQLIQIITRAQTFGFDVNAAPPPFPEDTLVLKKKAARFHYLNFLPPNETPFVAGVPKPQKLEIESVTARLILRKAVATLCAHAGFTDSTENVLTVLIDVVHDFLTKFTHLLRTNKDRLMLTGSCAFHDVLEQTLQDMRLGSLSDLHKMYRDRVMVYHARVKQKTLQLHQQYQVLLSHVGSKALSQSLRRESATNLESSQSGSESPTNATKSSTSISNLRVIQTQPALVETAKLNLNVDGSIIIQQSSSGTSQ